MQIYVLGPAYGLPSIDAGCVAAVALLQLRRIEGWELIPTHDQGRPLPQLLDRGQRIEGFHNISTHIEQSQHKHSTPLNDTQRADSVAISSFVEANAQTLLDISLYVSFENYSTTRTAFTKILPWHANYMLPPKRRAAARARTQHLGISSIDIDDVHEDMSSRPSGFEVGKEQKFEAETQKRASLLLGRKNTIRSLLQRPEHSAMFKLHALADNFFGPLSDMLGDDQYLLGTDEAQPIDCLAYGYLSLMLFPKLPQDWLGKKMHQKYQKLVQYTERMHDNLKMQTNVDEVMSLAKCRNAEESESLRNSCNIPLPWQLPQTSSLVDVARTITSDLVSRIPLIGQPTELIPATSTSPSFWQKYFPAILFATISSLGAAGYYALVTGHLIWPHGDEVHIFGRKRLADYGHLGSALAGISLLSQQASQDSAFHEQQQHDVGNPLRVEVAVQKDGVP